MNQKFLLFLCVLFSVSTLSAQKINLGVRGDVTYGRINGDGMSIGYKAGFNAGGFCGVYSKR